MQAIVLEQRGRTGAGWRDFPDPKPAADESVLKVAASSLNRVDLYMRDSGAGITHHLPQVMGVEAAGVVAEAEPGSGLRPGMKAVLYSEAFCGQCRYCLAGDQPLCEAVKIMGEHRDGGFAEYVAMPSRCFFALPDDSDLEAAGALMTGHLTAWRMLFGKRALQAGESILIVGIGGGVAVACLQLAKLVGARVFVTSSSDEKIARAVRMGAEGGVNYARDQVSKAILDMSGGGVDMVIDSVGTASWSESLKSLRRGGRLVTCGATSGSNPPADLQRVFIRQLEIYGSTGGSVGEMRQLLDVFNRGLVKPVIDARFAMSDALTPSIGLKAAASSAKCLWSCSLEPTILRRTEQNRESPKPTASATSCMPSPPARSPPSRGRPS
jgi:NADPH:quinone reductase-like Zn-dependent oxidoreductase